MVVLHIYNIIIYMYTVVLFIAPPREGILRFLAQSNISGYTVVTVTVACPLFFRV